MEATPLDLSSFSPSVQIAVNLDSYVRRNIIVEEFPQADVVLPCTDDKSSTIISLKEGKFNSWVEFCETSRALSASQALLALSKLPPDLKLLQPAAIKGPLGMPTKLSIRFDLTPKDAIPIGVYMDSGIKNRMSTVRNIMVESTLLIRDVLLSGHIPGTIKKNSLYVTNEAGVVLRTLYLRPQTADERNSSRSATLPASMKFTGNRSGKLRESDKMLFSFPKFERLPLDWSHYDHRYMHPEKKCMAELGLVLIQLIGQDSPEVIEAMNSVIRSRAKLSFTNALRKIIDALKLASAPKPSSAASALEFIARMMDLDLRCDEMTEFMNDKKPIVMLNVRNYWNTSVNYFRRMYLPLFLDLVSQRSDNVKYQEAVLVLVKESSKWLVGLWENHEVWIAALISGKLPSFLRMNGIPHNADEVKKADEALRGLFAKNELLGWFKAWLYEFWEGTSGESLISWASPRHRNVLEYFFLFKHIAAFKSINIHIELIHQLEFFLENPQQLLGRLPEGLQQPFDAASRAFKVHKIENPRK